MLVSILNYSRLRANKSMKKEVVKFFFCFIKRKEVGIKERIKYNNNTVLL